MSGQVISWIFVDAFPNNIFHILVSEFDGGGSCGAYPCVAEYANKRFAVRYYLCCGASYNVVLEFSQSEIDGMRLQI